MTRRNSVFQSLPEILFPVCPRPKHAFREQNELKQKQSSDASRHHGWELPSIFGRVRNQQIGSAEEALASTEPDH